jgi:hypothetical protein
MGLRVGPQAENQLNTRFKLSLVVILQVVLVSAPTARSQRRREAFRKLGGWLQGRSRAIAEADGVNEKGTP